MNTANQSRNLVYVSDNNLLSFITSKQIELETPGWSCFVSNHLDCIDDFQKENLHFWH